MSVEQPSWSDIYREQLSSLNHGLALWDPNPVVNLHKKPGHVSIGDVGYLDKGAFIRMFNVTLPWDDPSNQLHGKPEQYEHIKPGYNVRFYEIREGGHYTPHVSEGDNFRANTHEDSMGKMYQCKAHYRGALLSLPHEGRCRDVIPTKVFENYIKNNVDNWFRWSRKMNLPVENMEDLILVTGCTLVASWAAAAFDAHMSVDSDATVISLEVRKSDGDGTQFFWRNIRGTVDYRNSRFNPNVQQPLPRNQCVFIRGFRAKRTLFRIKSMRAGAEPLPDDPENRREDEIQVTQIPDNSKYRDPLVGILDYIVQKSNEDISAAQDIIAIAHDDDLQLIEGIEPLTADAVEKFLHEKQMPLIVRDGSAILRDPADNKPPVSRHQSFSRTYQNPNQLGGGYSSGPSYNADPQLLQWFNAVDTKRSGSISVTELQAALVNGNWSKFDLETVKMLMNIFSTNRIGTIGFQEFSSLWKYITDWEGVFRHFDWDRSGTIHGHGLSEALRNFGYRLSPSLLTLLEHKYASGPSSGSTTWGYNAPVRLTFDRFVRACAAVKTLSEAFQRADTDHDGYITISYEECMRIMLSFP